jgi:hypothetical protein
LGGGGRCKPGGGAAICRSVAIRSGCLWESASQPAMRAIQLAGYATGYNMFAKAALEGRA